MSRFFNGGTSADFIDMSVGGSPLNQGNITIAVLAHPSTSPFTGWAIDGMTASGVYGILVDSGKLFMENDFGSGGPTHGTGWCWYVATKVTGSNIPQWAKNDLTAGTGWSSGAGTANVSDGSGPITNIRIGASSSGSAANTWRGRIAALAVWNTVLSFSTIQTVCTLSAADLLSAQWAVLLNQASTTTAVTDITAGGSTQTALSGTAVDPDEPPGWSYSLTASQPDAGMAIYNNWPGDGPWGAENFQPDPMSVDDAGQAATVINAPAEVATATGAGQDAVASVASLPDTPVATGSGQDAVANVTVAAEVASATGDVQPASLAATANAEAPSGTGQALDATVSTAAFTNAPAEAPAGAGTALDGAPSIAVNPSTPVGLGAAQDAASSANALPDTPVGTGAGLDPLGAVQALPDTPVAAGSGQDATVSTSSAVNAPAEVASAAGAAQDASVASTAGAVTPAATGQALDATVAIGGQAEVATAAGLALDILAMLASLPDTPVATGSGQDATVSTSASVSAPAGVATATGTAGDATAALGILAGLAQAVGEALDLDTSGGTSSPSAWLISESTSSRALVTVTSGVLVSNTHA